VVQWLSDLAFAASISIAMSRYFQYSQNRFRRKRRVQTGINWRKLRINPHEIDRSSRPFANRTIAIANGSTTCVFLVGFTEASGGKTL
jgi:hypothetical protein